MAKITEMYFSVKEHVYCSPVLLTKIEICELFNEDARHGTVSMDDIKIISEEEYKKETRTIEKEWN